MESSSLLKAPKQKFLIPKTYPPKLTLENPFKSPKQEAKLNDSGISSMSTDSKDSESEGGFCLDLEDQVCIHSILKEFSL